MNSVKTCIISLISSTGLSIFIALSTLNAETIFNGSTRQYAQLT